MKSLKSFHAPLDINNLVNVKGGAIGGKTREVIRSKDIKGHNIDKCVDYDKKSTY